MALARLPINDTSLGVVRQAREKIPQRGLWRLENGLLDGFDAYRRGGLKRLSETAFGADRLTLVWAGHLVGGDVVLLATPSMFGTLDAADNPVSIGGGGLSRPSRAHSLGQYVVFDGGLMWAGATKAGHLFDTAVRAQVTNGSKTVGGSGFSTMASPGSIFQAIGSSKTYIVQAATDTQLTLDQSFAGPTSTNALFALYGITMAPVVAPIYAVVGKRLTASSGATLKFSDYNDVWTFQDGNEHVMPGAVDIRGVDAIGDTAAVFTTDGIWTIDNFSLEPVDDFGNIQHTLHHIAEGLILWHRNGIGHYAGGLIAPTLDGVWMIAGGAPERIDRALGNLLADYVEEGCTPGLAAVHRGHYFLPILRGNQMVDLLVCHLEQPDRPWTTFNGKPVYALAHRSSNDTLLAAADTPYIYEARYMSPGADCPDDDGTPYEFDLITRDYATGNGNKNLVRRLDVDYKLVDTAENDNPTLEVSHSDGTAATGAAYWGAFDWGEADWGNDDTIRWEASSTVLAEHTDTAQTTVDLQGEKRRARYVRFRVRSSGRIATLVIRSLAFWVRQSTKAD